MARRQVTNEQRERELKFEIPGDWELPDPAALLPEGGSVLSGAASLESTYFDTVERDLLRTRLTLRRRTGDVDEGWHLKVPDGADRIEVRAPLSGRTVPAELREATLGVRGRAALKPIATLRTERAIHRLHDGDGTALAELVVDEVTATELLEFAVTRHWREVEVELLDGDRRLLKRAAKWLVKHGARPSESGSKLARALDAPGTPHRDPSLLSGVLGHYLDDQQEAIVRGDLELRRLGSDADRHAVVHATRVATRRYRSVLREFAGLLDQERAAALEGELQWFAAALGEVRDRHVLRVHLDAALDRLPAEHVLGPVRARIDETLLAEQAEAEAALDKLMRSRRYFTLLAELRDWRAQLPVVRERPAADAARYLARLRRKVERRFARVPDGEGHDEALHRVRKAAKRGRYVAELSRPAVGRRAKDAQRRFKKVQTRLGDRQDSVLAAEFLLRAAAGAAEAGENGFTLGLLYERERVSAG